MKVWDTSQAIRTTEFEDQAAIIFDHGAPVISSDIHQLRQELVTLDSSGVIFVRNFTKLMESYLWKIELNVSLDQEKVLLNHDRGL